MDGAADLGKNQKMPQWPAFLSEKTRIGTAYPSSFCADPPVRLSIRLHISTSSACNYTYILALFWQSQLDDLEKNDS
jgi:hypothetical protein